MTHTVEYLIVGQGLAGTLLAEALMRLNASVCVIDNHYTHSASTVAAGLMDYISGKRLTLTWQGEQFIPVACNTYRSLESQWQASFLIETPAYRLFESDETARIFQKKVELPEFSDYYGQTLHSLPGFLLPFGGVEMKGCVALNPTSFLTAFKQHYPTVCRDDCFSESDLILHENGGSWQDISFHKILYCIGADTRFSRFFSTLPYRMAKGETLTLSIPDLDADAIYHFGKWLVPLDNHCFRFGATYEWDDLTPQPTATGKALLLDTLNRFLSVSYTVLDHHAAVRCLVPDLKPLIGLHPTFPQVGLFSGFGSRGVMMCPYFAALFAKSLVEGQNQIALHSDLRRF